MSSNDVKARAQARFGQFAQNYVTGDTLSGGSDLDRLLEVAAPRPDWVVLDVATGGGHTALKFAPHTAGVVATDFGMTMLAAARAFVDGAGATNVDFTGADAERLPFADASFDAVTCRFAVHHFPDAYRFVLESVRVLRPGGLLAILDHLVPEDPRDKGYIEAFERLRDPSHHRAFDESEWRGLLLDADLQVEHYETLSRPASLQAWTERQSCPPDVVEKLRVMLAQAPRGVVDFIHPRSVYSPDAGFDHVFALITGRKPG